MLSKAENTYNFQKDVMWKLKLIKGNKNDKKIDKLNYYNGNANIDYTYIASTGINHNENW